MRVAVLISGSGSNMVALVDDMAQSDHAGTAALVLSNEPEAAGLDKARARGVATAVIPHSDFPKDRHAFEAAITDTLHRHRIDLVCLAGFMRVLTEGFVATWAGRMINIHPSLLPKHRGLNTHARALESGDVEHGCTVHEVTAALDDGPILGQARLKVDSADTPDSLARRVLTLEHRLYPAVLRRVTLGNRDRIDWP